MAVNATSRAHRRASRKRVAGLADRLHVDEGTFLKYVVWAHNPRVRNQCQRVILFVQILFSCLVHRVRRVSVQWFLEGGFSS